MAGGGKGGVGGAQRYGVNPTQNAASGFQDSFRALQNAGVTAANAQFNGYSPVTAQAAQVGPAATYQAPTVGPTATYNPASMQAYNYQAHQQAGPDTIASQMGRYQNPYETQVVQNTAQQMQDALRQTQMGNADAAIASGAFGGGRHGVVEGVSNAQAVQDIGAMTAQLRQAGFDTSAGLAGQDAANRMSVSSQNQQAINAQRGTNAAAINAARGFNADAQNTAGQFNAGARNQTAQTNAGLREAAGQFNAGARNAQQQYNAGLQQDTRQFNAGSQNAARQFNAAGRYDATQDRVATAMGLGSQLGNLSQASYGVGRSVAGDQLQTGQMSQQLMQQILQSGQAGYDQQTQQAQQLLQMRLAALGMNPMTNATTSTATEQSNPGWGAMFGNLLGAAGNMFSFAPMTLPFSSKRYKSNIEKTGKQRRSVSGKVVDEVTYTYTADPGQIQYVGVVAEDLGPDDPAVIVNAFGQPDAVDYSKLETV